MALDQNHEQCNAVVKRKKGLTDLFLKDEALRRWLIAQPIIVDLLKDFHKEIGFLRINLIGFTMRKAVATKRDLRKN